VGFPGSLRLGFLFLLLDSPRVPHPCAVFAQEPALSEAEGVGFPGSLRLGFLFLLLDSPRVPHPCAVFAQEPALSEAEGVGFPGSLRLGFLFLGGAALQRCGKCTVFECGFSR
jgi:hypothetical protein